MCVPSCIRFHYRVILGLRGLFSSPRPGSPLSTPATVHSAPTPAPTWTPLPTGLAQAPAASATVQSAPPMAPLWNPPPSFVQAPPSVVSGVPPSLVQQVEDALGGMTPSWSQSSPGVPPVDRSQPDGAFSDYHQEQLPQPGTLRYASLYGVPPLSRTRSPMFSDLSQAWSLRQCWKY